MSVSRLKSLLLVCLIIINVFFLSVFISENVKTKAQYRRMEKDTRTVMELCGIIVDCELQIGKKLRSYGTTRDMYAEVRAAGAVLGECEPAASPGGGLSRYNGEKGSAYFNAIGEFVIELTEEIPSLNTEKTAKQLLQAMNIGFGGISAYSEKGMEIITVTAEYKDCSIINCRVSFEFKNNALTRVSGRLPFGLSEKTNDATLYSLPTLLMSLLTAVKDGEHVLTRILSVEEAYRFTTGMSGEGELSPGYIISTDTGSLFIDAAAGKIEMLSVSESAYAADYYGFAE